MNVSICNELNRLNDQNTGDDKNSLCKKSIEAAAEIKTVLNKLLKVDEKAS